MRDLLEHSLADLAESVGDHELLAILVDVAVRQEDLEAIHRYAPRAEELALRYGHVLYQGVAARAWGVAHRLAGEYVEASARLEQACGLFEQLGTRWQLGRTLAEQGHLALARGEPGRKHFASALELFEAMGAAPDAARTREILKDAR